MVPPVKFLIRLSLTQHFRCAKCSMLMVWLRSDNTRRVITIQHDRGGAIRFLCKSCNSSHKSFRGDDFYKVKNPKTFCKRCNTQKTKKDFYKNQFFNWCKSCRKEYDKNVKGA